MNAPKTKKNPVGRPKGSTVVKEVKPAKVVPLEELFFLKYGELLSTVAIYGLDNSTKALVNYLWAKPDFSFVATDPDLARLSLFNKAVGEKPFSNYRWKTYTAEGFIEEGRFPLVVVALEYWSTKHFISNTNNVTLINLENLK